MKVTVKFFSSLMEYLPASVEGNSVELDEPVAVTPTQIMERFKVPDAEVRTMMRNGTFLPEEQRNQPLEDGDTLTVWPAIQGG
jgi:sulfur carrier protein ThiS